MSTEKTHPIALALDPEGRPYLADCETGRPLDGLVDMRVACDAGGLCKVEASFVIVRRHPQDAGEAIGRKLASRPEGSG